MPSRFLTDITDLPRWNPRHNAVGWDGFGHDRTCCNDRTFPNCDPWQQCDIGPDPDIGRNGNGAAFVKRGDGCQPGLVGVGVNYTGEAGRNGGSFTDHQIATKVDILYIEAHIDKGSLPDLDA